MLSPITTVANVRTRGALSSDTGSGAATDAQLEASIDLAQGKMIALVTRAAYAEVSGWDSTERAADANIDKFEAFDRAESYLAMSCLPMILRGGQLAASGFITKEKLGNNESSFATDDEIQKAAAQWQRLAIQQLAGYITAEKELSTTNDNDQVDSLGVQSKDGKFFMMDT